MATKKTKLPDHEGPDRASATSAGAHPRRAQAPSGIMAVVRLLHPAAALASLLALIGGCAPGDVDLSPKICPCAVGYYCDSATRRCIEGTPPDVDAGRDASSGDTGVRDAMTGHDAASRDARVPDDGGPDAGAGTDAGTDAGIDLGPTRCDDIHAGAIFCSGMEPPGFADWSEGSYGDDFAYVGRATSPAFLGAGSLYAESNAGSQRAAAFHLFTVPVTSGDIYLRVMVYVPSGWSFPGGSLSFAQVGMYGAPYHQLSLNLTGMGIVSLYVQAEGGNDAIYGVAVPRDTWFCVEGHAQISDAAGVVELFLDGVSQGDRITSFDTLPTVGYQRVVAGLPFTDPAFSEIRLYLDEIVVSSTRVGCD